MRIGEVAKRSGISVRALRYYEEQELLRAARTAGGQRDYPEAAVDRVRLIQQLYAAGLPSSAIRELLPCVETGLVSDQLMDRLETERDRIDRQIAELTGARDRLALLMSGRADPATCSLPAA